jgi:hypothetical protein
MSADFKHDNLLEYLFLYRSINQRTSLEHLLQEIKMEGKTSKPRSLEDLLQEINHNTPMEGVRLPRHLPGEQGTFALRSSEQSSILLHHSPKTEPPRVAEFLVSWCIKKRYRKALFDDLDEDFQRDLSKGITVARARLRYWGSALHSITPQLLALAKRIGIFGLIADYARRLLH